jgi:hypothetical protein
VVGEVLCRQFNQLCLFLISKEVAHLPSVAGLEEPSSSIEDYSRAHVSSCVRWRNCASIPMGASDIMCGFVSLQERASRAGELCAAWKWQAAVPGAGFRVWWWGLRGRAASGKKWVRTPRFAVHLRQVLLPSQDNPRCDRRVWHPQSGIVSSIFQVCFCMQSVLLR